MKRLIILCIILGVLISLCIPCLADEAPLEVTNTQAKAGQTVYLAVTLNESVVANTIGIKCEYDKTLLTALPELCTWGRTSIVSAFKADNNGAWTSQLSEDLKGKLCVLAFQVNEDIAFDKTAVKCTVVLKDSAKEVGNYVTEGWITSDCDHNYGPWKSTGEINHTQICKICGGKSTQQHQWDEGTESEQQDVILKTMTCQVCREQKVLEISKVTGEVTPVEPSNETVAPSADQEADENPSRQTDSKDPSQSVNATKPSQQASTKPSSSVNSSSQEQDKQEATSPHDHDHGHEDSNKVSTATTGHTHSGTEATEQHEHTHTAAKVDPATVWVVVGLIALTLVGAFFAVRKKQ